MFQKSCWDQAAANLLHSIAWWVGLFVIQRVSINFFGKQAVESERQVHGGI
jgi:hypothetical protein